MGTAVTFSARLQRSKIKTRGPNVDDDEQRVLRLLSEDLVAAELLVGFTCRGIEKVLPVQAPGKPTVINLNRAIRHATW